LQIDLDPDDVELQDEDGDTAIQISSSIKEQAKALKLSDNRPNLVQTDLRSKLKQQAPASFVSRRRAFETIIVLSLLPGETGFVGSCADWFETLVCCSTGA